MNTCILKNSKTNPPSPLMRNAERNNETQRHKPPMKINKLNLFNKYPIITPAMKIQLAISTSCNIMWNFTQDTYIFFPPPYL